MSAEKYHPLDHQSNWAPRARREQRPCKHEGTIAHDADGRRCTDCNALLEPKCEQPAPGEPTVATVEEGEKAYSDMLRRAVGAAVSQPEAGKKIHAHVTQTQAASATDWNRLFNERREPEAGEKPQYRNRHGERCSKECGEGRHSECTETMETCNCTCRGGHRTSHRYMNFPPEPASPPAPAVPLEWCCKGTDGHEEHCVYHSPFQLTPSAPAGTAREFAEKIDNDLALACPSVCQFAEAYASQQNAQLRQERDALTRELCDMTPGGSEFVNDLRRCLGFVRERLATVIELVKQRNLEREARERAESALATAREGLVIIHNWIHCGVPDQQLLTEVDRLLALKSVSGTGGKL